MCKFLFALMLVSSVSVALNFKGYILNNLELKRLNYPKNYQANMNAKESTAVQSVRTKRQPISAYNHGVFNGHKCPRGMVALDFGPGGCVTCMTYYRITGNKRC